MRHGSFLEKIGIKNIVFFTVFFICVAVASFLGGRAADVEKTANALTAGTTVFEIQKGEGVLDVATRLVQNDIIPSRFSFVTYATLTGAFQDLKPGIYKLQGETIPNIVRMFTKGPKGVQVIIYPGMTISEIDSKLYENRITQEHEFEKIAKKEELEGFLMPDTYEFHQQTDARIVIKKMRENFRIKTEKILNKKTTQEIQKIITIASLIEKEVFEQDDRRIVSGIIQRRLADAYPLQIDAAVAYGACAGVFISCDTFTTESFKQDTPYNTYTRKGLPPHPIANPSLDSIDAAIYPKNTTYYFYLSDRATGKTYFSETFEEHNSKRAIYLK